MLIDGPASVTATATRGTSTQTVTPAASSTSVVSSEPTPTAATTTSATTATVDPTAFFSELKAAFPWLEQLGLEPTWFQEVAATSASAEQVLTKLRGSSQYKQRFPSIYRSDGSVLMSEAEYIATEDGLRTVLRQNGFDMENYRTPTSLVGFFQSEIDPNELAQRVSVYRDIEESSANRRDAFYVYAGLDVSVDDLYAAAIDPAAAQRLSSDYNQAIAGGAFDYDTFITRATEVGNRRVAEVLTTLSGRGAVTAQAVQAVQAIAPDFAKQIMDALYTGGDPGSSTATLSLEELLSTFELAAVGAAASNAGLELPSRERIAELRQAGVTQASAASSYGQYGLKQGLWDAASRRSGGQGLTQAEFENAAFLNDPTAASEIQRAIASETAAGEGVGGFRFSESNGRIQQAGLSR